MNITCIECGSNNWQAKATGVGTLQLFCLTCKEGFTGVMVDYESYYKIKLVPSSITFVDSKLVYRNEDHIVLDRK